MNLTEKYLEKLAASNKRQQVLDDEVRGFGLRIETKARGGRKSFFWTARLNGDLCFKSLGEFPALSVKGARDAARVWSGKASTWKQNGYPDATNPFAKLKKRERGTTPLFQQLLEAYIERQIRKNTLHPETAEYNLRIIVEKYLEKWLDLPIDRITTNHVLVAKNSCSFPYMQNSIVELSRRLFDWSVGSEDGEVNFWKLQGNPAKDVSMNPREKRKRFLQPEELVRFHAELGKKETPRDLRDFLILALATGVRKGNLYEAKWGDVSFELQNLHVPQSKNGHAYDVDLSAAALEVLKRRRSEIPLSESFVFPAKSESGHIVDVKKSWQAFRKRCGFPDVRLHDLRRSHASYMAISGASMKQIADALGHRSMQSTEVYAHLSQQAVAAARTAGEHKMRELMGQAKRRLKAARKNPRIRSVAEVENVLRHGKIISMEPLPKSVTRKQLSEGGS